MKHSWVMGVIILWLLIFGLEIMVTGGSAFNTDVQGQVKTLLEPTFTNRSDVVSAAASFVTNVGTYLMIFVHALFLYSPSIFTGYLIWLWVYVCLPVTIAMVIGVVIVLRGSSSG